MNRMIFINLPVRDLPKARAFYAAIGATINPQFSGHVWEVMWLDPSGMPEHNS